MLPSLANVARAAAQWAKAARSRRERAGHPGQLSLRAWREVLFTTINATLKHRVPSQAAAAAFYAFLAFAPGLAAFGSFYGLVADPRRLQVRLDAFAEVAPRSVLQLVLGESMRFSHGESMHLLGAGLAFAFATILGATSSVRAVMQGLNTAYEAVEGRRWWVRRLLGVAFAMLVAATLTVTAALILKSADIDPGPWSVVRLMLRWTALFAALMGALAVFYRYAPDRPRPRWRWVTPGSALSAAVTLATSAGVTLYLGHFASYERTYGGLGSIIGLLLWLWSGLVVVLAGAELNYALERKTWRDTSVSGRSPTPG